MSYLIRFQQLTPKKTYFNESLTAFQLYLCLLTVSEGAC